MNTRVAYAVQSVIRYRPGRPSRDEAYRRFIRRFPCIGCGRQWNVDAMHIGPHGLGQKAADDTCLPGCRACHREFDRNPRAFAERHGLDLAGLREFFQGLYGGDR